MGAEDRKLYLDDDIFIFKDSKKKKSKKKDKGSKVNKLFMKKKRRKEAKSLKALQKQAKWEMKYRIIERGAYTAMNTLADIIKMTAENKLPPQKHHEEGR